MPIFRTKGYRDIDCVLSISAIFPPPMVLRSKPDNKNEDDLTFHFTIVNNKDKDDERSAYIELTKKQLRSLNTLIENYLKTGVTTEVQGQTKS
jgi:hypothetical protein